jgi:hypothetical protein
MNKPKKNIKHIKNSYTILKTTFDILILII